MTTQSSLKKVSKTEFEKILERCKDTAKASLEDIEILGTRLIEAVPKIYDLPDKQSSRFLRIEVVKLDDIYCPPMADNPIRSKGKDPENIKTIKCGIESDKVHLFKKPIIVEEHSQIRDGVHYQYKCIDGNHRYEVYEMLGVKYVVVAVYELCVNGYTYLSSLIDLQSGANDHSSSLSTTPDDMANAMCALANEGTTQFDINDKDSIRRYVDKSCTNMHPSCRGKVVAAVIRKTGNHQNVVTYTQTDNKKWIGKYTDFTIEGKIDSKRNMHGWGVKEGYEDEYVMNAVRQFSKDGKESYFLCRTEAPSDQRSLNDRRKAIKTTFDKGAAAILEAAKFYEKHGRMPFRIMGYLPQDHKADEKDFIFAENGKIIETGLISFEKNKDE
jgi:hypothetical protein